MTVSRGLLRIIQINLPCRRLKKTEYTHLIQVNEISNFMYIICNYRVTLGLALPGKPVLFSNDSLLLPMLFLILFSYLLLNAH